MFRVSNPDRSNKCSLLLDIQSGSESHSAFYSMAVKWLGPEFDHWLPSTAKVKNGWSYTPTNIICLHAMERGNATFLVYV
jgi:hypothetical protein